MIVKLLNGCALDLVTIYLGLNANYCTLQKGCAHTLAYSICVPLSCFLTEVSRAADASEM